MKSSILRKSNASSKMNNSFFVHTLGCKVNAYESSALAAELSSHGFILTENPEEARFLILNTCSVTSKAGQKSRQHISSLHRKNPGATLLAMGCYTQAYAKECVHAGADIVLGTANRNKAVEYLTSFKKGDAPIIDVKPSVRREEYEELATSAYTENARAYLKVQDGCDAFCSYCYIPQLRGNSRSREPRRVLEEAERLVAKGYREIVITGIHTGMYGRDLAGEYGLVDLLRDLVRRCPKLRRIRISSLEEEEVDEAFLALLKDCPAIVSHVHMPLQAGSDKVLKDMKRRYDTARFLEKAVALRAVRPDIAITTDVIVGYPTETEEDFQQTLAFCEKVGFAEIHVFPFSSRPNTYAATLKDLSAEIKKDRVRRLLALSKKLRKQYEERFYGQSMEVLFEEYDESSKTLKGHTENYLLVTVPGEESQRNTFGFVTYDSKIASD